jgi:hypothetical protein
MFIKYSNNIHNLNALFSVLEGNKTSSILLSRNDGNYIALEFESIEIRDAVLKMIWEKLYAKERTFDIDKELETIKETLKYNL